MVVQTAAGEVQNDNKQQGQDNGVNPDDAWPTYLTAVKTGMRSTEPRFSR